MDEALLVDAFPRLYHIAELGAWPSIRRHGLLSTAAILDLFGVDGDQRSSLMTRRRPSTVRFDDPDLGSFAIRDQIPLSESKLAGCLTDMTVAEWLGLLNRNVFFWPTESRVRTLLGAQAYRNREHLVLVLDTAALVERYSDAISLSPINTGATAPFAVARGSSTITDVAGYPFEERRRSRGRSRAIAEILVEYAVPDVADITVATATASADTWRLV